MQPPIALQLYTLREQLAQDFEGDIRRVAEMGYLGIETAGFDGVTPEQAGRLFKKLGLDVCSAHQPLPLGDRKNQVLDTLGALNCKTLICAYVPAEEYSSVDKIKKICDTFNQANEVAVANGLIFGIHNHWWEFQPVEGQYPYQLWQEWLDPSIFFEVDTYWVKTAGLDPIKVLEELGARARLLHIKDGPATQTEPMVAVGQGALDYPSIITAANRVYAEWLIVELDRCATDMFEAVRQSYDYLVGEGLARGQTS